RQHGHTVRFIEYMDVGGTNGWRMDDVVPAAEILELLNATWPIEPIDNTRPGDVARRYRYRDGAGEVGVIASVTQPFCRACTRARLSARGELFTCLFAHSGLDLRTLIRSHGDDRYLEQVVRRRWQERTDQYSQLRTATTDRPRKIEMSYIGG
ncbi:MAG: hypothetical protein ACRDOH_12575, partial [Streptosporangiaceae bacterium]